MEEERANGNGTESKGVILEASPPNRQWMICGEPGRSFTWTAPRPAFQRLVVLCRVLSCPAGWPGIEVLGLLGLAARTAIPALFPSLEGPAPFGRPPMVHRRSPSSGPTACRGCPARAEPKRPGGSPGDSCPTLGRERVKKQFF